MFNGVEPSNEGCTNDVLIDGQEAIDCGQGTTLIDCDRGYNDNADYSDLSNYFIWNRTTFVDQGVSIVLKFDQTVNISRISMFFWISSSYNIDAPNVNMYWADYTMQFNKIVTTNSPTITENGQHTLNINVTDSRSLKYQYLKIVISFNNEWIFLSEMQFCGEWS